MSLLQISLLNALIANLLVFCVYFLLYSQSKSQGTRFAIFSWLLYCIYLPVSFIVSTQMQPLYLFFIQELTLLLSGFFFFRAFCSFFDNFFPRWFMFVFIPAVLYGLAIWPLDIPMQFKVLGSSIVSALSFFVSASLFFRDKAMYPRAIIRFFAVLFSLWGVQRLFSSFSFLSEAATIWVYVFAALLGYIHAIALLVYFFQRKIEDLQASEGQYRELVETIHDWMWSVDDKGVLTYVSPKINQLIQYDAEELMGRNFMSLVAPSEVEKAYGLREKILNLHKSVVVETRILAKDGREIDVETSVVPAIGIDNQCMGAKGIVRDITERKEMEKDRDKIQKRMIHSAKLATIGELAESVAHGINNPATIVSGYIEILRKYLTNDGINDSKYEDALEVQKKSLERIQKIVNALGLYAKTESDDTSVINIHSVLEDILSFVEYLYRNRNIDIQTRFWAETPTVRGNIAQFQQVLLNLLSNAKDALENVDGSILIQTQNTAGYIEISISDNGHGIKKEDINKVFEMFYSTKAFGHGEGIGLGVSKMIINQMNGKIDVDSIEGVGTTVKISLPVFRQKEEPHMAEHVEFSPLQGRVLVVDDEEELRNLLSYFMVDFGLEVDTAVDGDMALDKILRTHYDVVLTDLKMPKKTGEELILQMYSLGVLDKTKVIVIAGAFFEDFHLPQSKAISDKISGHISKPFSDEILYSALKKVLPEKMV